MTAQIAATQAAIQAASQAAADAAGRAAAQAVSHVTEMVAAKMAEMSKQFDEQLTVMRQHSAALKASQSSRNPYLSAPKSTPTRTQSRRAR